MSPGFWTWTGRSSRCTAIRNRRWWATTRPNADGRRTSTRPISSPPSDGVGCGGADRQSTASQCAQPGLWWWLDERPRERWPSLVRGDIAWAAEQMMLECEKHKLLYLCKLHQTTKVRSHIARLFGRSDWTAAGQAGRRFQASCNSPAGARPGAW